MSFYLISSREIPTNIKDRLTKTMGKMASMRFDLDIYENSIIMNWNNTAKVKRLYGDRFVVYFDGYLKNINPCDMQSVLTQKAQQLSDLKVNVENDNSGIYSLIFKDNHRNTLVFSGDPSGLYPIYYTLKGDQLYLSSHLHLMAKILDLTPDQLGINQKVTFGYTLGARTTYRDVFRLNPAEMVEYNISSGSLVKAYSLPYYTGGYLNIKNSEDVLYDSLIKSFAAHKRKHDNLGLMLSEGFDSRLIGGLAQRVGLNLFTFTHGTYGTKGYNITNEVSTSLKASHFFNPLIDGFPSDSLELELQLLLSDNLNVAYWVHGSKYFANLKEPVVVATGTALDTTLGGHSFYKPSKNKVSAISQRYFEILGQDIKLIGDNYIESLSGSLINNYHDINLEIVSKKIRNAFSHDVSNWLLEGLGDLKQSVYDEFKRIGESGSSLRSQVLQRFFLENRVRKFAFGQELTLRMFNELIVPSYEYSFMNQLARINPTQRLNHDLYIKVLRKYFPELVAIKNGGYGLASNYPKLILESSRFLNRYMDNLHMEKLMNKKGDFNSSRFRPVLVSEYNVRNNDCLNNLKTIVSNESEVTNSHFLMNYLDDVGDYRKRAFNLDPIYQSFEFRQIFNKNISFK